MTKKERILLVLVLLFFVLWINASTKTYSFYIQGGTYSKEYRWEGWLDCNSPHHPGSCTREPTIILADNPAYWKLLFCSEYDSIEDGCFEIFKIDKEDGDE